MIDLYQKNFHQKFSMFRTKTKHVIILFRFNISFQTLKLDGAIAADQAGQYRTGLPGQLTCH